MPAFEYVRNSYNVPACFGRRVIAYGNVNNYHPVDGIEYLPATGKVRKPGRSQARYLRYIEYGDCFDSFLDFCRWDAEPERSWNGGRA